MKKEEQELKEFAKKLKNFCVNFEKATKEVIADIRKSEPSEAMETEELFVKCMCERFGFFPQQTRDAMRWMGEVAEIKAKATMSREQVINWQEQQACKGIACLAEQ